MSYPFVQHIRFHPKKWEGAELKMKVDLLECIACGDGFTDRSEECDDGNLIDGDGCSGSNAVRLGYPKPCTM
jgi:cysteine-rich repeat protein